MCGGLPCRVASARPIDADTPTADHCKLTVVDTQFTEERMGQSTKTGYEPQFEALVAQTERIKKCVRLCVCVCVCWPIGAG